VEVDGGGGGKGGDNDDDGNHRSIISHSRSLILPLHGHNPLFQTTCPHIPTPTTFQPQPPHLSGRPVGDHDGGGGGLDGSLGTAGEVQELSMMMCLSVGNRESVRQRRVGARQELGGGVA
jgi:hypothetical protein